MPRRRQPLLYAKILLHPPVRPPLGKKRFHKNCRNSFSPPSVILLCLILALTLHARLYHGRRTFLSVFLVSLSGRPHKVVIRSMPLKTRAIHVLYIDMVSSDSRGMLPFCSARPPRETRKPSEEKSVYREQPGRSAQTYRRQN